MGPKNLSCVVEPFSVAGADVAVSKFTAEEVAVELERRLRKQLASSGSTVLEPSAGSQPEAFIVRGRLTRVHEGNQMLRWIFYFLGKPSVGVAVEVCRDGKTLQSLSVDKQQATFALCGGSNKSTTMKCAGTVAKDIASSLYKLARPL